MSSLELRNRQLCSGCTSWRAWVNHFLCYKLFRSVRKEPGLHHDHDNTKRENVDLVYVHRWFTKSLRRHEGWHCLAHCHRGYVCGNNISKLGHPKISDFSSVA